VEGERGGFGMLQTLRPPQQLSFDSGDGGLMVRADLGIARTLYLDGREMVDTLGDMTVRTSKAKWKKGKLEIERKVGDFSKVREIYWLDPETGFMVVDVKLEAGPRKAEARRIYERASPN
jgi:hypothetical protein